MKYIIIGLGHFGASLCEHFASMGHEVIGIDLDMRRVEELKSSIENVVCLDAQDRYALYTLPLADTDAVYVTIGQNLAASVYTIALLRQIGVKRLIGRALSPVHATIIQAIGVDETISPEVEYAKLYANKVEFSNAIGGYDFENNYHVLEIPAPEFCWGKKLADIDFEQEYSLQLIAVKHPSMNKSIFSKTKSIIESKPGKELEFKENDTLLLFGSLEGFRLLMD